MKKYTFIAVAFAALATVSCVKDNMGGAESKTYQASFTDKLPDAKATIAVGQQESLVSWEVSDRVGIMYGASNLEYKADQAGSHSTLSAVSASADASEVWALLPYDPSATLSSGVINTVLPSEQSAKAGASFHHLAVAHSTSASLAFSNVCGLVRVKVTTEGITKVVFAGKADEKVAGNIAITVADCSVSGADAESVALVPAEGETSIAEGDYFLAVLPQTFQNGFTVTAYKGETAVQTKDIAGPVTLERCGIIAGTIREVTISAISTDFATVGETITVTGTGFSTTPADNVVTIGGKATEVTSASATELKVTVPKGLSRNADYSVDVTVKGANKVSSPKFRYWFMYNYTVSNWLGTWNKTELKEGTGTSAYVGTPYFMALDPTNSDKLWIIAAASTADNNKAGVLSASISTGNVTVEKLATSSDTGLIKSPFGGAFKPGTSDIYLALKDNKSLSVYNTVDKTSSTSKPVEFNNPMDLVFTSNGNYYVADRDNNRIVAVVGETTKVCSLGFKPNSLLVDPQEQYMFIGTNGAYALYRVKISDINEGSNTSLERIAGTGANFSTHTNGTVGQPTTATIGNIAGMCFDPTINYLYYFDLKTKIFQVFIPGLGGDWSKGTIKTVIGTDKSSSFCNQGGEIVFADGNFYVAAKGVQKVLKISKQ